MYSCRYFIGHCFAPLQLHCYDFTLKGIMKQERKFGFMQTAVASGAIALHLFDRHYFNFG